jgi:hypothetical protein
MEELKEQSPLEKKILAWGKVPALNGKMAKEIVALVLAGQVDPDEASRFLLGRAVRKYA